MSLTARLKRFIIPGTLRRIPVRLAARPGPGPEVTERQRESYPEQGFLVAGKVLDDAELQDWRTAVDQAVDGRGRQRFSFAAGAEDLQAGRPEEEQEYYDQVFTQRNDLRQTDEKIRRLLLQPALGKYVTDLAGIDGVRIWHDQALINA